MTLEMTLESSDWIAVRPPQDVAVLADFQIPFSRPETPGFYLRSTTEAKDEN